MSRKKKKESQFNWSPLPHRQCQVCSNPISLTIWNSDNIKAELRFAELEGRWYCGNAWKVFDRNSIDDEAVAAKRGNISFSKVLHDSLEELIVDVILYFLENDGHMEAAADEANALRALYDHLKEMLPVPSSPHILANEVAHWHEQNAKQERKESIAEVLSTDETVGDALKNDFRRWPLDKLRSHVQQLEKDAADPECLDPAKEMMDLAKEVLEERDSEEFWGERKRYTWNKHGVCENPDKKEFGTTSVKVSIKWAMDEKGSWRSGGDASIKGVRGSGSPVGKGQCHHRWETASDAIHFEVKRRILYLEEEVPARLKGDIKKVVTMLEMFGAQHGMDNASDGVDRAKKKTSTVAINIKNTKQAEPVSHVLVGGNVGLGGKLAKLLCTKEKGLSDLLHTQPTTQARKKTHTNGSKVHSIGYPGNKYTGGTFQRIINQIPPHDVFYSGFLGTDAVLVNKKPARTNIGTDVHLEAVQAFWDGLKRKDIKLHRQSFFDFVQQFTFSKQMSEHWFIYLDPPYKLDSRPSQSLLYKYTLTDEDHQKLIDWALFTTETSNVNIAISHYPCALYDSLLEHGWRKIEYEIATHKGVVTEILYMNYPEPTELHDYSHLGRDRTDRQRIKRKRIALAKKLDRLPVLERMALIEEVKGKIPPPLRSIKSRIA